MTGQASNKKCKYRKGNSRVTHEQVTHGDSHENGQRKGTDRSVPPTRIFDEVVDSIDMATLTEEFDELMKAACVFAIAPRVVLVFEGCS